MYKIVNFIIILAAIIGLVDWSIAGKGVDYTINYGHVNVASINTGNLQLKGVTWCKKYFDQCVFREKWNGPFMASRETVSAEQFVTMQTSIDNPEIVSMDIDGDMYKITFIYDQEKVHNLWVPEYKEK